MNLDFNENIVSTLISITALFISLAALYYTIRAFSLKIGQRFRCTYSIRGTIECDDEFIGNLLIENLKDRAAIIFKIYLKLGLNNYLLIEDFSDSPLILKPFEVYYKEYDPILFYSLGTEVTKVDMLIRNKKVKKRILLSTTNGKYLVKSSTKRWSEYRPFFKNYSTAIICPVRYTFRGIGYGSNVKFLVAVTNDSGDEYVISIYKNDYKFNRFSKFKLTKECLETKDSLEEFIIKQKKEGNFEYKKIEIFEFQMEVDEIRNLYPKDLKLVESYNFFQYRMVAKFLTIIDKYKLYKKNRNLKKDKQRKIKMEEKIATHNNV